MRTLVVVLSAALAVAGCQSKSSGTQATPGSNVASGSATVTPAPVPPKPKPTAAGTPIALPKGDGTPPKKTTAKLNQAMSDRLKALEFPGFNKDVRFAGDHVFDTRYSTIDRPTIGLQINVGACLDCTPMELDKWKPKAPALKQQFPEELRERSDSIWDLHQTELNGQPMIAIYQFGHQLDKDEKGNPASSRYSSAYFLFFNDGVNQIRVVASYIDDPVSRADLERLAPRADLEKIAKAFMDTFTHTW